jgi:hypothetical protein
MRRGTSVDRLVTAHESRSESLPAGVWGVHVPISGAGLHSAQSVCQHPPIRLFRYRNPQLSLYRKENRRQKIRSLAGTQGARRTPPGISIKRHNFVPHRAAGGCWQPQARLTTMQTEYLYRSPFSLINSFLIAQTAHPCFDFALGAKGGEGSCIFLERIFRRLSRPNNRPLAFHNEFHAIAFFQAETATNRERIVICPLLLRVLFGGIFTCLPYSKD